MSSVPKATKPLLSFTGRVQQGFMGGRIHGFLAGSLVTSAFVYYTGEYIKKDQQFVSRQLRISDTIITEGIIKGHDLHKDGLPIEPRGTEDVASGIEETSKDIWNEQVIKLVNWIYSIDWYGMAIKADKGYDELTTKIAGSVKK